MDWLTIILGALGSGGAIYGFIAAYKAQPEKVSYEIKNLRELIEEIKRNRDEDKKENREEIERLNLKIGKLELNDDIKSRAISKWLTCHFIPRESNCPVAEFIENAEKIIQKKTEQINNIKEKRNNEQAIN